MEEQLSFKFDRGRLTAWRGEDAYSYWERYGAKDTKHPGLLYARIAGGYREGWRYILFVNNKGEKINWQPDQLFKPTLEEAQAAADTILLSCGYILD